MREHVRRGRRAGIPIGLNLSVAVILVLVITIVATQTLPAAVHRFPEGASWAVVLLVGLLCSASLLTHELAHALVTGRYGVRVEKITLWMLGGVAQLASEPPTRAADLRIAGAGPLTSLAAGAGFGAFAGLSSGVGGPVLLTAGLAWLAGMRVLPGVSNPHPMVSFDGRPVGVVTAGHLAQLPATERAVRRVGDVVIRVADGTTAGPDDALADVLDRAGRRLPALLMEHGDLVGMVTDTKTNRLLPRAALSAGPR